MMFTQSTTQASVGRMLRTFLSLALLLLALGPVTVHAAQAVVVAWGPQAAEASQQVQLINARYTDERAAFEAGIRDANRQNAAQAYRNYERYLGELLRALDQAVFARQCAESAAYNYLLELEYRPYTFGNTPALKARWLQLRETLLSVREHRNVIDTEIRGLWGRWTAAQSGRR